MENNKGLLKRVKVYGQSNSREAYLIRDFLKRSVVTYDWIPIDNGSPSTRFDIAPAELKFPVVELPCGNLLFNPTIADIANKLGWVTKPKHQEYDVSIFGGGAGRLKCCGLCSF